MKALTHRNRKGVTYHLGAVEGRRGKTRYVFARTPSAVAPSRGARRGYEVVESVNGIVSLRRKVAPLIRDDEMEVVRASLARHGRLAECRLERRANVITVYRAPDALGDLGAPAAIDPTIIAALARRVRFDPELRFVLIDPEKRLFTTARMCHRSSVDGWLPLHVTGPLVELARRTIPHLGRDSFYELC